MWKITSTLHPFILLSLSCVTCTPYACSANSLINQIKTKGAPSFVGTLVDIKTSGGVLDIPNTIPLGGKIIDDSLGIKLFFDKTGQPYFAVLKLQNPALGAIVTDAAPLPRQLYQIHFDTKNLAHKKKKKYTDLYQFSMECTMQGLDEIIIVAMVKAMTREDAGFEHNSSHVWQAWGIRRDTGKIQNIRPTGVSCSYH